MSHFIPILFAGANLLSTKDSSTSNPAWISITPILISMLALVVSGASLIITAYYQYFGRPKLRCLLSQTAKCFASHDGLLGFTTGVTIFNEGAQYGSIYRINATLKHTGKTHPSHLYWAMFVEPRNVGKSGQEFQPHDEFIGWPDTLVVPNRSAVYKRVLFRSREPFEFTPGRYDIDFEIFQGTEKTASCKCSSHFDISEEQAAKFLKTKSDPTTRISTESITFPMDT